MSVRPISAIRLIGGRPSMDLVNTIHDRSDPREDYLCGTREYLEWAERAGLLTPAERKRIGSPDKLASSHLADVKALREQLHDLFVSLIERKRPQQRSIDGLNDWLHRAWRSQRLSYDPARRPCLREAEIDGNLPLLRVARDALDVLLDVDPARIKLCAAPTGCGWLFVDDSKNNSRRWCCMDTCGTAFKMKRYRGAQDGKTGASRASRGSV